MVEVFTQAPNPGRLQPTVPLGQFFRISLSAPTQFSIEDQLGSVMWRGSPLIVVSFKGGFGEILSFQLVFFLFIWPVVAWTETTQDVVRYSNGFGYTATGSSRIVSCAHVLKTVPNGQKKEQAE